MHLLKGSLSLNKSPLQQPGWLYSEQIPFGWKCEPALQHCYFSPLLVVLFFYRISGHLLSFSGVFSRNREQFLSSEVSSFLGEMEKVQ